MNLKQRLSITALALTAPCLSQAAELKVTIDQINSDQGHIMAQIFQGAENYQQGKAHEGTMIPAKTGVGTLHFKNLTPGEYVVRLFHDANDNQTMDSNAFGMPTEGYGFSNEAIGNMGPPTYEDMVVVIEADDDTVTTKAKMIYL